jgi:hypothetical protein
MMDPVPIPKEIVQRFANKTMLITGYESDQVQKTPQGDKSWPINFAYNHHFEAWLGGAKSQMIKLQKPDRSPESLAANHGYPRDFKMTARPGFEDEDFTSTWFSEGNGGEYRKSFHGYPQGYGQLLDSPETFHFQPMQIDTHNRDYNGTDFRPGILPSTSAAPPNAKYSGLLECPCTNRRKIVYGPTYFTQSKDTCPDTTRNATECFAAASKINLPSGTKINTREISQSDVPFGCSLVENQDKSVTVYFNSKKNDQKCGQGATKFHGTAKDLVQMDATIDASSQTVTITITGPGDKWFGIGFGSTTMPGTYAIAANDSAVWEQKLGEYAPGTTLQPMIKIVSNTVQNNVRTVVVTRPMKGATSDHYTFSTDTLSINYIDAIGSSQVWAHHAQAKGGTLNFVGTDSHTCICYGGIQGSIDGDKFSKNCVKPPNGDLYSQRNPTCFIELYEGGLHCCRHKTVLLDADQVQPEPVDEYHLKFRFYFQEFDPKKHQNLIRVYGQTEQWSGEYDVPKCDDHTPPSECVHAITARWTVGQHQFTPSVDKSKYRGIKLIYAGGHCHAPACISMELYNEDTGKLLCRQEPVIGTGTEIFNEEGYIAIPPCLWSENGQNQGLLEPDILTWDTNLMAIKRNNNTNKHYGEMASWQMRGILVE